MSGSASSSVSPSQKTLHCAGPQTTTISRYGVCVAPSACGMFKLGQNRPYGHAPGMSAVPPITEVSGRMSVPEGEADVIRARRNFSS